MAALPRQPAFVYFVFLVVENLLDHSVRQSLTTSCPAPPVRRLPPFLADADSCLLLFGCSPLAGSRHNVDPASGFQPTTQIPNLDPPSSGISA
jgi:hypothetical protein